MSNTERRTGKTWSSTRTLGLRIGAMLLALVGCDRRPAEDAIPKSTTPVREDLLIGYGLLADTLSDESHLRTLDLFKKLTLNASNDAIAKMMQTLSEASTLRADELSKLRHLAPDVSDNPTQPSPIGDAITDVAKEFGKSEMLSRSGGFDVRFVLLQAQATRMVAAMATAIARFEPNPQRKKWLKSIANEYEGYRGDLIKYLSVGADSP
jgi:hypothetical protein